MRSIFPESKRSVVYSKDFFHTDQNKKLSSTVPEWISGEPQVFITHAIGSLQQGESLYSVKPKFKNSIISRRYSDMYGDYSTNAKVSHINQDIVLFNGCDSSISPEQKWPKVVNDTIHISELITGKPVSIVGKVIDYYMNSADMKLRINNGPLQNLTFYKDFGKWAGRLVDIDGNGKINSDDKPDGALFFASVDSNSFTDGENSATIYLKNKFGKKKSHRISVICGPKLEYHEANSSLLPESRILGKSIKWDLQNNEDKNIYIVYSTPLDVTSSINSIGLQSKTGENLFSRVSGIPGKGQFLLESDGANTYSIIKISTNELKKENGIVTPDQSIHICVVTADGNRRSVYSSFYIDNDPPVIRVQNPVLISDYNMDGIVDENDSCVISSVTATHTDCHAQCDTISDPFERTTAFQLCEQSNNTTAVFHYPECDGKDNDFDGFIDSDDKSEYQNVKYHSPEFSNTDSLLSEPVSIDFTVNDNIQEFVKKPQFLKWRIFKVNGNELDTTTDQVVFTKKDSTTEFPATINDI